jgi:uncharacterized protein YcbX
MDLGTLATIWIYPVKSLRGEARQRIAVTQEGLAGDRASALFVRDGHARAGKTFRGKEHERLHLAASTSQAQTLAGERGIATEIRAEGRYFDDAPVSLLFDRWLDDVSAHVGYPVEPQRYRSNFFVHAAPGFSYGEAALEGASVALGDVLLRVRYGIERCVATTYDQQGGASDPEILRYVATQRGNLMGVYCDVLRAGDVCVGDTLRLLER